MLWAMENSPKIVGQIVEIPTDKIMPNPDNPAGPVDQEEAHYMALTLKETGQKKEVKVRLLTPEEKAQYTPYEYLLLGGHIRLEGAKLAGLPTLRAVILEKADSEQEFRDAALDNRARDMGWWRWDLVIERLLKPTNGKDQAKVTAQLGMSQAKVSKAWKITQALNPGARELVAQNYSPRITKNKGFLITESILLALADLGDPAQVEKALRKVLDDRLAEAEVKKLVAHLKEGGDLEGFGKAPQEAKAVTKSPATPQSQPRSTPPRSKSPTPTTQPTPGASAAAWSLQALFGHRLAKVMAWVGAAFEWIGVKNKFVATVLAVAIVLFVTNEGLRVINYGFNRLTAAVTGLRIAPPVARETASVAASAPNPVPAVPNSPTPASGQVAQTDAPVSSAPQVSLNTNNSSDSPKSLSPSVVSESPKAEHGGEVASPKSVGEGSQTGTVSKTIQASSKKGDDLGKVLGDGVKDANDAVHKADEGKDAVDKAKSLLGF